MAERSEPFEFTAHAGDVGHSMVIGPIGSGKTVSAELAKLWSAGHPGGSTSVAQADDNDGE
ncbi:hypothetical protein [Burkholderia cepacia]|uniref:hypothetical protein n=1 Tax=Burkholderia cepacia TaxID=292 RepID=UPI0026DF25CD|nr:hypothetical protein [Burkholderia cepacia]MDO5947992.1 hypothetical protein [Burkholderia cepacia]